MKTDRELLELAAKAAGYQVRYVSGGEGGGSFYMEPSQLWWSPLDDDGDALRLAVDLHLLIDTDNCCAMHISKSGKNPDDWADGELEDDHLAATRRAIVRAAAAIGETCRESPTNS